MRASYMMTNEEDFQRQHKQPALDPQPSCDRNLTLDKDRREKSALDQLVFNRHKTIDAPIFKDATKSRKEN